MKKILFIILLLIPLTASAGFFDWLPNLFNPTLGASLSVLRGSQGGTGVSSTIAGNVGTFLQVASTSPNLTYTFAASGGSGSFTTTTINGLSTTNYTLQAGANVSSITTSSPGTITFNITTSTVGGSTNQIQYNNGGVFAGDSNLTWSSSTSVLVIGGASPTTLIGSGGESVFGGKVQIGIGAINDTIDFSGAGDTSIYRNDGNSSKTLTFVAKGTAQPFRFVGNSLGSNVSLNFDLSLLSGSTSSIAFPNTIGTAIYGTSTIGSLGKWTDLNTLQSATAGTDYVAAITAGTNITLSSSSGNVTINSTGGSGFNGGWSTTTINGVTSPDYTFSTSGAPGLTITSSSGGIFTWLVATSGLGTTGFLSSSSFLTFNSKITTSSLSVSAPLTFNNVTGAFAFGGTYSTGSNSGLFITSSSGNLWTFDMATASLGIGGFLSSSTFLTFNSKITTTSLSVAGGLLTYNSTTGEFNNTANYVSSTAAGTGISVSGATGAVTITNTQPHITSTIIAGGITYNGNAFTFTTTTDTNLGLTITSSTGNPLFTPVWIGTLADARITSAATWNAKITTTSLSVAYAPLAYNNTTGVFTLPTSTGSQSGFLSSANWTTFNGKQDNITFPIPAASSSAAGATTQIIYNNANVWAGDAKLTWTSSTQLFNITGTSTISGNVGIGTTTPPWKLAVNGGSGGTANNLMMLTVPRNFSNTGDGIILGFTANNGTLGTHDFGALFVGNNTVGVDGGAGVVELRVGGAATTGGFGGNSAFIQGKSTTVSMVNSVSLRTGSPVSDRLFIDVNGNVGIGTTTPAFVLTVVGNAAFPTISAGAAGDTDACLNSTTNELTDAGASTCIVSSIRFKDNVKILSDGALQKILQLKPSSFVYKNDLKKIEHIGLIAEDMLKVEPRLVFFESDGVTPRGIGYEEFTALLTKAIQEQQKEIDDLKIRLLRLEQK